MKIRIVFALLLFASLILSACSKAKIKSTIVDTAIQIDGSASDWENVPLFFNKKPPFVLGAVNDTNKLSLMLRFNDPTLAQMMYRRGFNIWFDDEEQFGLNFSGRRQSIRPQGRQRVNTDSLNRNRFQNMGFPLSLSLQDFDVFLKGSVRNVNQTDVRYLSAASGVEEGLFCFEFSVPLVPESERGHGAVINKKNTVNITFKIKEMKRPAGTNSAMSMRGGGMSGGKSGGMRGGGRKGGGRKGAGIIRADRSATEFKAIVQLAASHNN